VRIPLPKLMRHWRLPAPEGRSFQALWREKQRAKA
jgi:hypothetical protein